MLPFIKGTFDAASRYVLSGKTINAIYLGLRMRTPVAGNGITLKEVDGGFEIHAEGGGGGVSGPTVAAFWRVYQNESKWWLQGGQVTGGEGNEVVPDIELGTAGSEPTDGTLFWLECTGSGDLRDGILYGGFDLTGADPDSGTSIPDNTLPTVDDATGRKFHLLLGSWNAGNFSPSAGGNLNVNFCPGGYSPTRF